MSTKNISFSNKVKVLDQSNFTIEMIGSTQDVDRVGDRMIMSGVKLDNYLKNPVILTSHNYTAGEKPTVVGKALDVRVEGQNLIFVIQFAETENAKDWYYLYSKNFMSASSIGFNPIKYTPNKTGGYDFEEWELLELSLVSVPCNPNAIQRALEQGYISKSMFNSIVKDETIKDETIEDVKDETIEDETIKDETIEDAAIKDSVEEPIVVDIETENKIEEPLIEAQEGGEQMLDLKKIVDAGEFECEGKTYQLTEKTGATLSKKTMDMLNTICKGMQEHCKSLENFLMDPTAQGLDESEAEADNNNDKDPEDTKALMEKLEKEFADKLILEKAKLETEAKEAVNKAIAAYKEQFVKTLSAKGVK